MFFGSREIRLLSFYRLQLFLCYPRDVEKESALLLLFFSLKVRLAMRFSAKTNSRESSCIVVAFVVDWVIFVEFSRSRSAQGTTIHHFRKSIIIYLVCPTPLPQILHYPLFLISPEHYSRPRRNRRQWLCQILGGKQGALWCKWKWWMGKKIWLFIHPRNSGSQATVHPRARPRVHPHHRHIKSIDRYGNPGTRAFWHEIVWPPGHLERKKYYESRSLF